MIFYKNFVKHSATKLILILLVLPMLLQFTLIDLTNNIRYKNVYVLVNTLTGIFYLPYLFWLYTVVKYIYEKKSTFYNLSFFKIRLSLTFISILIFNFIFFKSYILSFVFYGGRPNINVIFILAIIQFLGFIPYIYFNFNIYKLLYVKEKIENIKFTHSFFYLIFFSFPPITILKIQSELKNQLKVKS